MNTTEKRRSTLINIVYFALIIAAYYLFIKYAAALIAPFLVAFAIAMFLQKPVRHIAKKTRISKKIIAAAAVFLILAVVAGVLALVGYKIAVEFKGLGQYLLERLEDLPALVNDIETWLKSNIGFLPDSFENTVSDSISSLADKARVFIGEKSSVSLPSSEGSGSFDLSILSGPIGSIISTAKQIPMFFTATLISIIACFFLTCDYDNFTNTIKKNLSEEHEKNLVRTKRLFTDVLGKMFKSYATIILITFCEVAIGLNIMKFFGIYEGGYIIAIALTIAIVDIFPVLGTGTILWPWSFICFVTGDIAMGISLIIMYAVISVLRQIIEPKLVSMNIGIHPVITLMGMYLGAQLFGVLGIFILPITFFLVKALNDEGIIHLWGRKNKENSAK